MNNIAKKNTLIFLSRVDIKKYYKCCKVFLRGETNERFPQVRNTVWSDFELNQEKAQKLLRKIHRVGDRATFTLN